MKYETIGGKLKDTDEGLMTIRELRIGDRFTSRKRVGLFEVWNNKCVFNRNAGSSTRKCKNLNTGLFEHKLCRIQVIRVKTLWETCGAIG